MGHHTVAISRFQQRLFPLWMHQYVIGVRHLGECSGICLLFAVYVVGCKISGIEI
jgi:hypothetical protein